MNLTAARVPVWVHTKAVVVLSQFRKGALRPCRLIQPGRMSLQVTPFWRLLSRNGGKDWMLISHERYNKLKDRK